jgi:hypothetical protein
MTKRKESEITPPATLEGNAPPLKMNEKEYKHFIESQMSGSAHAHTHAVATAQAPLPMPQAPEKPLSTQIWNEIKDLQLSLFALTPKPVHTYCKAYDAGGDTLYLDSSVPAFLPALETLVSSKYDVQRGTRYIEVSLKPQVKVSTTAPYPTRIKY